MKKKIVSAILCVTMVCSCVFSFDVQSFAAAADTEEEMNIELELLRYDNPDFEYKKTEGLEIVEINEVPVLTWPAVDKEGNLINANPLTSTSKYGNPTGPWTRIKSGMIIEYENWTPEVDNNKPTTDNKSDHNILFGLTQEPQNKDYPVLLTDYDENKEEFKIGEAYIDTRVVATSFATAYQIQYSKDKEKWEEATIISTVNHNNKIARPADNEKGFAQESPNTFYLEDQITTELSAVPWEPETKYYIRVNAYDASKAATKLNPFKTFEAEYTTPKEKILKEAFPTVEGGGKFSQGGRGGDVYVVENLTDSISDPKPGSFRYGLERLDRADKDKSAPRTIVFAVGGTIHIDPQAPKGSRKFDIGSNTTIAGQTAPGNGITIAGASAKIAGDNIIVRYMRFRLGEGYDMDAVTPKGKNIVIDHCSTGWGVDEIFSPKELVSSTVQWSTVAEGLSIVNKNGVKNTAPELNSAESEVRHGMGGIWNGYETTFHHNLIADCGTRNPRFEGGFNLDNVDYTNKLEYSNNVVYNWQHNSGYGGERANGKVNFRNNYYQPGPDTQAKVISRFFEVDGGAGISSYYIDGNVMMNLDGTVNQEVTNDNTLGFADLNEQGIKLDKPLEFMVEYVPESAKDAFEKVVNSAGASIRRDAQDARIFNDIRNNTGFIINSEKEAGGFDEAVYESDIIDSDKDGMSDEWEKAHNLNPNDKSDAGIIIDSTKNTAFTAEYDGYSNIEAYINEIAGDFEGAGSAADVSNPTVKITNIEENQVFNIGNTYEIEIQAEAAGSKSISKVEFYIADEKAGEFIDGKCSWIPEETGRYILLAKAYDSDNMQTFSNVLPVYVIDDEIAPTGFTVKNIGGAPLEARAATYYDENGNLNLSVLGSGLMGITSTSTSSAGNADKFTYVYMPVTGDVELSARVKDYSKIDTMQKAGIMIRENIEDDCPEFYMPTLTLLKGENYSGKDIAGNDVKARNIVSYSRRKLGYGMNFDVDTRLGLAVRYINEEETPAWIKIKREGNKVTTYASMDGSTWYTMNEYDTTLSETCYIGFVVDGIQNTQKRVTGNLANFSDIRLNGRKITTEETKTFIAEKVLDGSTNDYLVVKNLDFDGDDVVSANDAAINNAK